MCDSDADLAGVLHFLLRSAARPRLRQVLRVPPSRNLVDCRRRSRAQAGARREGARRGTPGRRRLRARCLPDLENQTLVREALVPPRRRRRCRAAVTAGARDVPAAEEMRLRRHVLLVVDHDEPVDRCRCRRRWRCRRRRRNWFLIEQAAGGSRPVERREPVYVHPSDRALDLDEGLPVNGALNTVGVLNLGGDQESRGASARGDGGERRLDVGG